MIVIACRWGGFTTPVWILPAFFLSGVLFYINRDLVPTNGLIGLGLGMGAALAYRTMLLPILAGSFLVYAVFWFAYVPDGWIRKYNDLGDYSYGLYIYAFPVQQTLAALRPGIAPLPMFLAAFPLVAGLAVVSWHVVEKPSLALKERIGTFSLFNWRWKAANAATSEQSIAGKALNNRIIDNPASLAELPPQ
jgi:peptidoglycan/LPS O-acetylase OafA/YrhL